MSEFYLCDTEILGLSHSAVKIYSFLRMVNNSITHESFYKRSNIAALCHVSESTVARSVRELRSRGLLKTSKRFLPSGQQTSNSYILIDYPQLCFNSHKPQNQIPKTTTRDIQNHSKKRSGAAMTETRQFRCNPAILQKEFSPGTLKVYSYLSLRAGTAGKTMPAKKEISTGCNISISTVSRAIVALRAAGLIEVHRQTRMDVFGNNGNSVNLYVILPPTKKISDWKRSQVLHSMLFFHSPISFSTPCFLPSFDILPHVIVDTARTISRMKLKQRKKYIYSKLIKRSKHARKNRNSAIYNPPQYSCSGFLFSCYQFIKQGAAKLENIVGLPVIVSARFRIVINSSLRRTIHVLETDRVKLLTCRNSLQIFNSSTSIPGAQEKNISAGRFNLPTDWAKKNGIVVGDHVFLIATSDCILVRPSVSQSDSCRKEVLQ